MSDIVYYIICGILTLGVLIGISMMSKVKTSVMGNGISGLCTGLAMFVTLYKYNILTDWMLWLFIFIGLVVGLIGAYRVKMIQMPQAVAILNGFGGAASSLVAAVSLISGDVLTGFSLWAAALALIVGSITLTGSLVAGGKLAKVISQRPVVWKNHQLITVASLIASLAAVALLSLNVISVFWGTMLCLVISGFFGVAFAIRVGGADMPITISLLNSLSGVAGSIAGMAINDPLLVAIGGIVGSSGLLLTQIMCRAMNRKLSDILFSKAAAPKKAAAPAPSAAPAPVAAKAAVAEKKTAEKSPAKILADAKKVIIVPGYGMALAQAQRLVKNIADTLEANGADVKFAIHPVAGRMPGHMNVLLCEVDVPYEKLFEMEQINGEFASADAVLVVGANDVMNPAANTAKDTPIYGMPVLDVGDAKHIIICNYDLKPGYAGVENPLYHKESGVSLLLGDAVKTLGDLSRELDAALSEGTAPAVVADNDPAKILADAKKVIIVPGYGMALAQAQRLVKNIADTLEANGTEVKFAIHPVAGRMPGHMNVLLCEVDVPYEKLFEMEQINGEFASADAVLVVGANDVMNPAANTAVDTPIYGMPVLNVGDAKHIIICNYDLKPGYAGVENPLYHKESGVTLLLGDAIKTLGDLSQGLNAALTQGSAPAVVEQSDPAQILMNAKKVIIVPGYGMALAQAQSLVKQIADKLEANGTEVKFAIHPVAGRMPGHMNVLLCEVDVPYEKLFEMEQINGEFASADAVLVVGANDVMNPAANTAVDTPIYGMPVLNVGDAKHIIICNYDLKPGYAGVENPLYHKESGVTLLLGDAIKTLSEVLKKMK